jgi:hypothetical protein
MMLSLLFLSAVALAAPLGSNFEPDFEPELVRSKRDLIGYNRMQNNVNSFYSSHRIHHKHSRKHPSMFDQLMYKANPETRRYLNRYLRSRK